MEKQKEETRSSTVQRNPEILLYEAMGNGTRRLLKRSEIEQGGALIVAAVYEKPEIFEWALLNSCSRMVIASALGANHIGMASLPHSNRTFHVRYNTARLNKANIFQGLPTRISRRGGHLYADRMGFNHAASGRDNQQLRFNDELPPEPFFLGIIKETVWGLRSLFIFLAEQPSQLKYIEWPSFQSTLKTATFALVLVALLIVALSSVDSVLSYILTFILRRTS
ncbi:hypothetical protein SDJN03_17586, partial [Cucurbita argyrosperma subsp. sororia]